MDPAPGTLTIGDDDRRMIGLWAADCAERVLPLFEAKAPRDTRPREAIAGGRYFATGGRRTAQLRTLVWAAYAAAREVEDPSAAAAARAAGLVAGVAYMHTSVTPDQTKHALGSAAYAARARELAAGAGPGAAEEEIRWAVDHAPPELHELVRRMPVRDVGRGALDALLLQVDTGLRR